MDGYAAYNKLARSDRGDDGITLAGCWSHSRRKFYELHVAGSSEVATATLERMAKLWQVEKTVRGQSPDARVAARQQASAASDDGITLAGCWSHSRRKFYELHVAGSSEVATATLERMAKLWQVEKTVRGQSPDAPRCRAPASLRGCRRRSLRSLAADLAADLRQIKLAEAIRYAVSRRAIFERFLLDGRIELDSNIVERAIRPQTITRKNSLFAGSDGGGRTWATIATLLQTADFTDREHRFRAIVSTEFRRS
ncbi:hypothetical protein ABIF93_011866 [Bradyrhizobium japonicum]